MKYMTLYVEVVHASGISDEEVRGATAGTLSGALLKTGDGSAIGQVVHAQVTEGPKPTRSGPSPRLEVSDGDA